jgi:tRNA (guanine-N7-)-methyltransferase
MFKNPYSEKLEQEFSEFAFNLEKAKLLKNNWRTFFKNRINNNFKKLILEIGCSNAQFLTTIANQNQDCTFIGLDWKFKVLYKGAKKVSRLNLKNVVLIRAKAQEIEDFFSKNEIDEVWIFFPDPWAKNSQLKNRLINPKFLEQLHSILNQKGSKIFFKTDHPGYFEWVLTLFGHQFDASKMRYFYDPNKKDPTLKGMSAKQALVRKLTDPERLPQKSEDLIKLYDVQNISYDYWNDLSENPKKFLQIFSNEVTLFEKGFLEQKLPIYYLELEKK